MQVSDEVIRNELRHQIVTVAEPAATVTLQREAQREAKLIGIGGGQFRRIIAHAEEA